MDIDKILRAKRRELTTPKPEQAVQPAPEIEVPPEPLEMEAEPQPMEYLEALSVPLREDSVYSSGWSLAELMDEFSQR